MSKFAMATWVKKATAADARYLANDPLAESAKWKSGYEAERRKP